VDRFIGFKKAVEEYTLHFLDEMRIKTDLNNSDDLERKLHGLLSKSEKPTAIFCLDDDLALRVIAVLHKLRLSVPDDVSIIAPGDTLDYRSIHVPQITTMRINTSYMGELAGQLIMKRIQHKSEEIKVLKVKEQLVERKSCRTI